MSIPSLFHRGMLTSEPPSCSQSVDVAFCRALMLRKRPYSPPRLVLRPQTPATGVGFLNPENSPLDSQDPLPPTSAVQGQGGDGKGVSKVLKAASLASTFNLVFPFHTC